MEPKKNMQTTMGIGGGISVINPDESEGFLENKEDAEKFFGTGNIGPDRIRLTSTYAKNPHKHNHHNENNMITMDN